MLATKNEIGLATPAVLLVISLACLCEAAVFAATAAPSSVVSSSSEPPMLAGWSWLDENLSLGYVPRVAAHPHFFL